MIFFKIFKSQNFSINCYTGKRKQKQTMHGKRFVELTEKCPYDRKLFNIYDRKLFKRNYDSECLGVLLEIDFVSCKMKEYLIKFFWIYTKLQSLLDLQKVLASPKLSSKSRGSLRHGNLKFWFSKYAHTNIFFVAISSKSLSQMCYEF